VNLIFRQTSFLKNETDAVPKGKRVAGIDEKPQHSESQAGEKSPLDIIVTGEDQVLVVPISAEIK
jgi:hypothetical protein